MEKKAGLKEKIIVALDVGSRAEALSLVTELEEAVTFKVGLELFTAEGPSLIEDIKKRGKSVFLDLKFHDIPNTVAGAVKSAFRRGVRMLTLHSSGGVEMMRKAAETALNEPEKTGSPKPLLLAITVLTSLKSEHLGEIGMEGDVDRQVLRLAGLARNAGMDGVVCSPREIEIIKKEFGPDFLVVTPGIRPAWAAAQDQKRILAPAQAIRNGADYLVIGRPITGASSPREAFLRILKEIREARKPPRQK